MAFPPWLGYSEFSSQRGLLTKAASLVPEVDTLPNGGSTGAEDLDAPVLLGNRL